MDEELTFSFTATQTVTIGELHITPFVKTHDASDPHSFVVTCRDIKVGVFTDIGVVCEQLTLHFSQCHAAFLEANYDEEMLETGNYPFHLKRRIRGGKGHLSNKQALALFITHKPPFMSHLLLSHLSKNNNCPKLVQQMFDECAAATNIIVASRVEETAVYYIGENSNLPFIEAQLLECQPYQTSLF